MAQWYNLLTLHPEQSGSVGSILERAPPLESYEKGLRTGLTPGYLCDPSASH